MQRSHVRSTTAFCLILPTAIALVAVFTIDNLSYGTESSDSSRFPLRLALIGQLNSPDPHEEHTISSESVFASVCEKLVEFDGEGEIQPGLAVSWQWVEPATLRLKLRQDVRFHDGRPFTATDAEHSLERAKFHPKGRFRTRLATISEVTHVDPYLLDISTHHPDPLLLKQLAFIGIMPAGTPYGIDAPICTGPYLWTELKPEEHVKLQRFSDYWGITPEAQDVTFQMESNAESVVTQLLAGQTHLGQLNPAWADTVDSSDDLWIFSRLSPGVYYLKFNIERDLPQHPAFRSAVDLALDRDALVIDGFKQYARTANQLVSPNSSGFVVRNSALSRDLQQSNRLLNSIPSRHPVNSVSFLCLERDIHLCSLISDQLADAGIAAELQVFPPKEFHELSEKGLYDITLLKWHNAIHDANDVYANIVHSKDLRTGLGIANDSRLSDATLDAWIEQAMYTLEVDQRQALMSLIADRVAELQVTLPLVWEMVLYAGIQELEWTPRSDHRIAPAEVVVPSFPVP